MQENLEKTHLTTLSCSNWNMSHFSQLVFNKHLSNVVWGENLKRNSYFCLTGFLSTIRPTTSWSCILNSDRIKTFTILSYVIFYFSNLSRNTQKNFEVIRLKTIYRPSILKDFDKLLAHWSKPRGFIKKLCGQDEVDRLNTKIHFLSTFRVKKSMYDRW